MPQLLGDINYTWPFYAGLLVAYLLGSIPFGLIIARLAGKGDIRTMGSGNIGAANVLRTGSKILAGLTLALDAGKGALAVLIAQRYGPDMAAIAGGAVVIGHIAPIWLKFQGGKAVATGLAVLAAITWPVGILAGATWLVLAGLFRYVSIAGLGAFAAGPLYAWWFADQQTVQLAALIAVLVWIRHASNIRRLLRGQEPKINEGLKS